MPLFLLRISGLCGFVPKRPISNPQNQVEILMPEARRPPPDPQAPFLPHYPVLRVANSRVVNNDPNLRPPDRVLANGQAVFYLADQDLWIHGEDPADYRLEIASAGEIDECPETLAEQEGFEWVAPIEKISPGSGSVLAGVHSKLVARARLTRGDLKTTGFAYQGQDVARWEFKLLGGGQPSGHRQALAEEVTLERQYAGNTIDLSTGFFRKPHPNDPNPWGAPRKEGRIRLKPYGGEVVASLLNMPQRSIEGNAPAAILRRRPDRHFEHFYDLSQAPGTKRVPWVVSTCPDISPPSAETPLCPPSRFP